MTSVACERLVVDAVEARRRGEGTHPGGVLLIETRNSRFLLVEGVCTNATDPRHMGSVLVGWLHDGASAPFTSAGPAGMPRVSGRWRPGARAVLVPGNGTAVVTSPALRLLVNGAQAPWDHATHDLGALELGACERSSRTSARSSAAAVDDRPSDEPTMPRPTLVDGPPHRFSLAQACSFDDEPGGDDEPTYRYSRPTFAGSCAPPAELAMAMG